MTEEQTDTQQNQEVNSIPVVDASGNTTNNFSIDPNWLERNRGDKAVHDVVVAHLAERRQGTASTRNRASVRGSGAKPWRQKGTGRARSGTRKSPLWRGGGVIFGPTPRDYSKKVNTKVRKLAFRRALTSRIDQGDVILIDKFEISAPKTKSMIEILNAIGAGEDALIILEDNDNLNLQLSARNLPLAEVRQAKSVNIYQLLLHKKIVITTKAMEIIGGRLR